MEPVAPDRFDQFIKDIRSALGISEGWFHFFPYELASRVRLLRENEIALRMQIKALQTHSSERKALIAVFREEHVCQDNVLRVWDGEAEFHVSGQFFPEVVWTARFSKGDHYFRHQASTPREAARLVLQDIEQHLGWEYAGSLSMKLGKGSCI